MRRQHLTAVRAAATVGHAEVEGAALSSTELVFHPCKIQHGEYAFDIGSAGSTTLVFQTVLPALLMAQGSSLLTFAGGTHNHGGPPWDFLEKVFLPAIQRMGARVTATLERHGFAPGGGGRWTARIAPSKLRSIALHERGKLEWQSVRALVSNLPLSIAEREIKTVRESLNWPAKAETVDALGPGNIVMIAAGFENAAEMATGFGERGVPAEVVAKTAVDRWKAYERTTAAVGEHLADQLLLSIALAGTGSFTTIEPTLHTITNAEVIAKFLPVKFRIEPKPGGVWTVSL